MLHLRGPGTGAHVRVPPGQRPDLQASVEVRRGAPCLLPAADAGKQQVQQIGLYPTGLSLQVQVGTVFTTRSRVLKEGSRDVLVKGAVDLHLEAWVGRPAPASFLASDLSWSRRSSSSLRILTDKMKLIITKLLTADI